MNDITMSLRAVNVPSDLPHLRRAQEIQQVVDHLRVDLSTAAGTSLVHMGTAAPPLDRQDMLWVRRNPDGTPAGLYLRSLGRWVRATPNIVESQAANQRIVTGTGTFTYTADADTPLSADIATFTPEFEATPVVQITVKGGTMYDTAATFASWGYKVTAAKDKWSLEVKSTVDCSSAAKTIILDWIAIGVAAE